MDQIRETGIAEKLTEETWYPIKGGMKPLGQFTQQELIQALSDALSVSRSAHRLITTALCKWTDCEFIKPGEITGPDYR